ncbi:triphosphoribosyl-dephospho-CoA synthase [uncultured Veillonella sp.]|uniref:triphosphoribosyl-dephospho-CoA synthase n=1 Tax=uncultured Veillonella sp. TaxID=159268 RepID=UPI0025E73E7E|nr:triphosphoribosyl-dephospho-CoA synthase [uncultured Veillonella sp.]MDY3973193.1 triphosphoribosyl-dephospho-CoA synthase [Veillonella caviae]
MIDDRLYERQFSPLSFDLDNVSQYLTQAILLEVCTHPKPGLVTKKSNGSHKDMDVFTFMMSSAVLSKAFNDLYVIGKNYKGPVTGLLKEIRAYGVDAEKELLRVTSGINTQRGILFAGGVLSGAAGYIKGQQFEDDKLIPTIRAMTFNLVDNELKGITGKGSTAGEKLYNKYGITGIRGEVAEGFPSVLEVGLPALEFAQENGATINDSLVHTLIALMTLVEDSNVVWRTDFDTLQIIKNKAKEVLTLGSVFSEKGRSYINQLGNYCEEKNISPGGSADLLSITIALYLMKHKSFASRIDCSSSL